MKLRRFPRFLFLILLIISTTVPACKPKSAGSAIPSSDGITNRYAVLMEKDQYDDVWMSNLRVDYVSMGLIEDLLLEAGWTSDNIHAVPEFTQDDIVQQLNWLEEQTDGDDLVFFYVASHGRYLSDVINWSQVVPPEWEDIRSEKIVLVDSCEAGKFIQSLADDPGEQIAIGAVQEYEYGWCGLEEEGLPIIGLVYTHYFSQAFQENGSDSNDDGHTSIQEAALWAETWQRIYMHEVVFEVPEFADDYRQLGIDPENNPDFPQTVLFDTAEEDIFLDHE